VIGQPKSGHIFDSGPSAACLREFIAFERSTIRGADGTNLQMGGCQERSGRTSPPIEDRGSGAAGGGVYGYHGVVIGALGGALVGGQALGFVVAVVALCARSSIGRRKRQGRSFGWCWY
jgi:hypothetical protein